MSAKYDYHFKHMTTVGEPIRPRSDALKPTRRVGKGEAVIVDTWWQTETGGFLGSTLPAAPVKPGSCGPAALGIFPVILDEDGNEVPLPRAAAPGTSASATRGQASSRRSGAIRSPSSPRTTPSTTMPRSRPGRHDWPYFAFDDGAVQAADGYFHILGRVDDVINVA